ncbi:formate-dependent nitrite reductase membrane component NrfD [Actinomadura pelletieri DSM 43383]|uniref:Formate-dependent nitrite reductase membrane component NrfD n=1 Tax=Actinomadura pelletieri DSM 43383 TaxID=1120940 RepID=A0A495QKC4_9ACTN|nr:NrfD/PsrC family molybdoenzyme membrane anchor subunit [Actinomadura pelletieri]RKS73042.1 formate-dependent nitrite reductase membrane component NrfD [Actinomadura pelletieri DSM 43383]
MSDPDPPGNTSESTGGKDMRKARVGEGVRHRRRGRGKNRGEKAMVPEAEFTSYYGKPILNPPVWKSFDVAGYFFLGGLAGAGSVLAAGAGFTGRPRVARALKISSLAALGGSTAALIHDLGRPERFANMLRVMKPTSPMSMGSWLLAAYGPAVGGAAVLDVTGWGPRLGRAATAGAAALGPVVATYTAVLAADTAVPGWHEAHRELPFVFAGSATAAASGMALVAGPVGETGPMRTAAVLGTALELASAKVMRRRMGMVAETYTTGRAGKLLRAADILSVAGATGAVLGGRHRAAAALAGAALLAGSACTRFGVFHAGVQSARDPKYTVIPQRERLRAAAG